MAAPTAPVNPLTLISATSSIITVSGDPSGTSGSPFTSATFHLYTDASGTVDASGSPFLDSVVDASGNYMADFLNLSVNTHYWVDWYLTNATGDGSGSDLASFYTSPSTPANPPTLVTATAYTLTVSGDSSGIVLPIDAARFNLYTDASGSIPAPAPSQDLEGISDTSGNYTISFNGLDPSGNYWVNWYVTNVGGSGLPSGLAPVYTTAIPDLPSAPVIALALVSATPTSLLILGTSTDASGAPFTGGATFTLYSDASGNEKITDTHISTEEGSNNYQVLFNSGLSAGTEYWVQWFLTNEGGDGPTSSLVSFKTLATCFLRGSKILCLKDGKEEYMRIEDMRAGTEVKTLNGTYVKVHTIGKSNYNNPDNADRGPNRLFRLTPSNYPELTEDLIVTGCHSILVDKLEPKQKARHLQLMKTLYMTTGKFRLMAFIDEKAEPYQNPGKHEIWHFALENENVVCNYGVYANGGLLVETASIKNMVERSGLVLIE